MKTVEIAKVCHQINKAYCESQGDMSQKEWGDSPDWQIKSAEEGVKFHIDNPDASPSASHDNWLKQKIDDGWIYGEEKNEESKTHPCCVAFEKLPKDQQAKDSIFKAIVDQLKSFL